jgi:hypothetical protein
MNMVAERVLIVSGYEWPETSETLSHPGIKRPRRTTESGAFKPNNP